MQSRQLYGSITATSVGTIYFDVPKATRIRAINFAIMPIGVATGDYIYGEVSLNGNAQTGTNDAQGVIAVFAAAATTSLASTPQVNVTNPVDLPVPAGTRIYLNVVENGGATWTVRAVVWFD